MKRLLPFLSLMILAAPLTMSAATWFVNARIGSNANSGLTSLTAKRTISAAIMAASAGDQILVAGGVYYENLTVSKRLTLFAYEPESTVVNGRQAGHCLQITESASGSVIDGFVFEKGAPTNSGNKYGGGVDAFANATIRHCVFRDNGNSSTTFAGGLHTSGGAQVLVENCLFVNNYAWASGGATLTEAGSTATFDRCTFYGNRSDDFIGNQGGISVANTGTVIVRSCILWGNSGAQIAAYGSYYGQQSTIRVSYSCVQGGVAANGAGHFYNDGGNISADPRFINAAKRNFWFPSTSPCWRMGHPSYFEADGLRLHMGFWHSRVRPPLPQPPFWECEITLDANEGDCSVSSVTRNRGDRMGVLPTPVREDYDFLGWYDALEGGHRIVPLDKVFANRTVYAHWQQRPPVLFKVNGKVSGVTSTVELKYILEEGAKDGVLWLNGKILTSTEEESNLYTWQPQKLGENVFVYDTGKSSVTTTVNVASLTFATVPVPHAPMPVDDKVQIAVETRTVDVGGAMKALSTAGSGTWTAASSAPWIVLSATSGKVGTDAVAYTVTANTNIGERTGFVYVSGHVHTIVQGGRAATVDPENIEVEVEGGSETVNIDFSGRFAWDACPNADWLSVSPTHGTGASAVTVTAAPYNEVGTRQGTVTIGDNTVTVFQYGRRMKLSTYDETRDSFTHVIPITVDALAITSWNVTPNASWISIVDAGAGNTHKGGGYVNVAIAENPSYRARTGTVTIGTEVFTVTQEGRTDVTLSIDPENTTASVNGANGHIAVLATPDLPWSVQSQANWLTVLESSADGAGNGNVFYTASPNTTLVERRGTIVLTPDADSGLPVKTHTVVQPPAVATLSLDAYEFAAPGESVAVSVTVPGAISWTVDESLSWLSVQGGTSRLGSGTVTLLASENNTVNARSGTVSIAGHTIAVRQRGRGFNVDCDSFSFGTESDFGFFTVTPDGGMSWEAEASEPSWIQIQSGWDSGDGVGEVMFAVTDYFGDGTARSGYIQVGDKKVMITQRAYELSITPASDQVAGNAGEGEVGVSATIGDVWNAIATEPWITIITDTGSGNGTVRYTFTENDTGKTRSGKIIIAGEEYTLTQAARVLVNITGEIAAGHGMIDGAGQHDLGEKVNLRAVPDEGYEFLYWTIGGVDKMQNPLPVVADVAKTVTATFAPLTPEFLTPAESTTAGVRLSWTNLAWAAEYRLYRAPSSEIPSEPLATFAANGDCTYVDDSGELEKTYWYWVEAVGADDTTESKQPVSGRKVKPVVYSMLSYENLQGATHANPDTYREETTLAFTPPSARVGYTFAGWTPAAITADMTGDIAVTANWTANAYQISYYANGGSGTMAPTPCTYDRAARVATNEFVRSGYLFLGWATTVGGAVAYEPGALVTNLTSVSGGVVQLYAAWEQENVADPVISPADGTVFKTASCTVTITCETEGASIYYSANGRTPRATSAYLYTGPFVLTDTATVTAFAVKGEKQSDYVDATITYVEPVPLTLKGVLDEGKLGSVTTGGEADWTPVEDAASKVGDSCAVSGVVADNDEAPHTTWMEAKVSGQGTLTFWWRVNCEPDPRSGKYSYDYAAFTADGAVIVRKDGADGWAQVSHTFTADGEHTVRWTYTSDGYEAEGGDYEGRVWVDGVTWSGASDEEKPSISGDSGATVTGDAENGYVVTPSAGKTDVEVEIPSGVDAGNVTVAVGVEVRSVKPRGAKIIVVKGGYNLTEFLDIPDADANGVVDMTKANVKPAIVKEALDPKKGAVIKLDSENPVLTTAATKPGLTYTLHEGAQLKGMAPGATKTGDGLPWTPAITVKGGKSGFYSIHVTK